MTTNPVILDTRHHPPDAPPEAVVGGLTLFERATRVAAKCGWERCFIVGDPDALPEIEEPHLELRFVERPPVAELPVIRSDVIYEHGAVLDPVITIESRDDLRRAEDYLWESCRKDADGVVSRHLNRHVSLAISRQLADTPIRPNHVTAVTFALGVVSAVFAAIGGAAGFAIAGVLFQVTSVLDGVDGELARVRMEGSVLGEWLDTISDDSSDVLLYAAVGVGAWRTLYGAPTVPPELWLWLGVAAAVGKLASMAVYYHWLAARGRGDLLAFTWSFDEEPDRSPLHRTLSVLRYVTKNDFIALTVMMLGLIGLLPWLLVAAVPGTIAVAIGAVLQARSDDDEPPPSGESHESHDVL